MTAKEAVLHQIGSTGFGIKPTEGQLLMSLLDNYGININEAKLALQECMMEHLIDCNYSGRYGITQEGLDFLERLDNNSKYTQSDVTDPAYIAKKSTGVKSVWMTISQNGVVRNILATVIGGLIVALAIKACDNRSHNLVVKTNSKSIK